MRQHFGFEQIADAPRFLFQRADNFFEIFHELLPGYAEFSVIIGTRESDSKEYRCRCRHN